MTDPQDIHLMGLDGFAWNLKEILLGCLNRYQPHPVKPVSADQNDQDDRMGHAQTLWRRKGRMPQAPARQMGTWKLAYADFLTALAAFFLVMWLVKGVPDEGRADLAEYFRTGEGAAVSVAGTAEIANTPANTLARVLRQSRLLSELGSHLSIAAVDDTVRIDLMDRTDAPLFESAGLALTQDGKILVEQLSSILGRGDWPVGIEGHTDAFPSLIEGQDNWDLSTGRAHTARRALIRAGLANDRIVSVAGLADTLPINPGEPHHSANRRVTLILHVSAEPRMS